MKTIDEQEVDKQVVEQQMIEIYSYVDDYLKANKGLAQWRQSINGEPKFTDAEVITIGLMQGCFGVDTLIESYDHIHKNYRSAFPYLCCYKQWINRLHQLDEIIGKLLAATCFIGQHTLYLVDSKPIPVCHPIRHGRVRLLREDGSYWGKTSKGCFFGFKLHTLYNIDGCIINAILTPANWDDRDVVLALSLSVDGGIMLADLGYRGDIPAQLLADEADMLLIRRSDAPAQRELISSVRQKIETLFSQLANAFIDKVFSRSWRGLWNTIKLKMLNYNLRHLHLLSA